MTMKLRRNVFAAAILTIVFSSWLYSDGKKSADPAESAKPFLGRWDLTLKAPNREYPSWLEITQDGSQLKVHRTRWDSLEMDGRESTLAEESRRAEVGEASPSVQRQGPRRMEDERPQLEGSVDS